MTNYTSTRIIDGKPRKVDENGKVINRSPTKEKLKGINVEHYYKDGRGKPRLWQRYTDEQLLDALRRFEKEYGRFPTCEDFNNNPIIISQTSNEIREENMRDYYAREEIMDRVMKERSHYIRGTEEYYDATQGKTIELPSGHDDVWTNNLGYYILSDNPNYNPNTDKDINNLSWTRIEKSPIGEQ